MNLFSFTAFFNNDAMTSDHDNQDLSEFDSDDDLSVASYETAPEEPELSDGRNPNPLTNYGREWTQLIQRHGSNPDAFVTDANEIETFDMVLQSLSCAEAIVDNRFDIENFSSAKLKFMWCPRDICRVSCAADLQFIYNK
ncbi:hypothetical protein BJV82DRAFT_580591 [Fennellomyces sp. T-0311]|nr:hypothetical protein BJV82DRAFT_580591 [Fennellomyces sp. T-0311]